MKTWKIALLGLATLALAACGGKDKKKPVTASEPVVTDTTGGEDTSTAPVDTGATDPSAQLQEVVYFEFDSSELDDAARTKLEENATWLKEDPARVLTIEGHTDEVGTTDYNLALGERRARTTKEYLVRLGVEPERVSIITYGEERPASEDDSLNRRSMFIATKKPAGGATP